MIPEVYGEKGWSLLSSAAQYYEDAKECFKKALEEFPDNIEWNVGYATDLSRLEGFSGTPKVYEHSPLISHMICSLNEEYDKAEEIYNNLLTLKGVRPENKQAICLQAGLFELKSKRSESNTITDFLEGVKVKYNSNEEKRCRVKLEMIVERRLHRNPRDCKALSVLGFLHQLDGEKSKAIEYFEKALEFDPANEIYLSAVCELKE
ncbi:hypothetical protein scyTo_0024407 [Scyliorhinus torazame]|uniref:Tetratricopeptide repeat protein n=1 Tax=Scyliorhinus torazame TaxID=75743 RepID=A0A401QEE9_SCYTO|nr:hypothetical protein [Scyliorhinus torazame]